MAGPGQWDVVDEVAAEALTTAKLPPSTPWAITQLAWATGFDPSFRDHGNSPLKPQHNRTLVLGSHVRYCLVMASGNAPFA